MNENSQKGLIDEVRIAEPCPVSWDAMQGDARVRHCDLCAHHVYNFAEMTRDEAEQLLQTHEGRLCARMYVRPNGTMMTSDCPQPAMPRGFSAIWARFQKPPRMPSLPAWLLPAPPMLTGIVARPNFPANGASAGTSSNESQSNRPNPAFEKSEEAKNERTISEP